MRNWVVRGLVLCLMALGLMGTMTLPAAAQTPREICREAPVLAAVDRNGDEVATPTEIRNFAPGNTRLNELAGQLEAGGITGIRYTGCTPTTETVTVTVPSTLPATSTATVPATTATVPATTATVPATTATVPATTAPVTGDLTCQVVDGQNVVQDGECSVAVDENGACTITIDGVAYTPDDATIAQGACGECPAQLVVTDGTNTTIVQVTGCDAEETPVAPGETPVVTPVETETETETETPVETETETETETVVETETDTDTATETETDTDTATETETDTETDSVEEEEVVAVVETLPSTGQGPTSGLNATIIVLLGATSVLALAGAAALRQRRQA